MTNCTQEILMNTRKQSLIFLILLAFSCSSTHDQKLHLQSVETHDLAIKIAVHVKEKIEQIDAKSEDLDA